MGERLTRWLVDTINSVERVLIVCVMAVMALILIVEVIAREIFGQGMFGSTQLAVFLMIWASYLGFGYATVSGTHLRPRLTDKWLPDAWAPALKRVGNVVSFLILCVMGWAAVIFVQDSYKFGETAIALGWVTWPFQIIIPLEFFLTAARHLSYAVFPKLAPAESELAQ